jgi:hypothetical protein
LISWVANNGTVVVGRAGVDTAAGAAGVGIENYVVVEDVVDKFVNYEN